MLNHKLSEERVKEIACEYVDIEWGFVFDALPCDLVGMNAQVMIKYV